MEDPERAALRLVELPPILGLVPCSIALFDLLLGPLHKLDRPLESLERVAVTENDPAPSP
jgi:hypothetical protein